jgi:hypothetical protein
MLFRIRQNSLLFILVVLDASLIGGCVTLAMVNQLLNSMMQRMVSIEARLQILDAMDHLVPYYVVYGGLLLLLIMTTISVWVWTITETRLRYGLPLVFALLTVGGLGWVTISRLTGSPIPPRTPTPTLVSVIKAGSGHENSDATRPFPTSTASVPPVTSTPTPTSEKVARRIPLHRSGPNIAENEDQLSYQLVEDKVVHGDVIADTLNQEEMMCVQLFDPSSTRCICWIGPLENSGIQGTGVHGMRKITILGGSVEEAALALIDDWSADLRAHGEREPCSVENLTVSYDGGVFRPVPNLK